MTMVVVSGIASPPEHFSPGTAFLQISVSWQKKRENVNEELILKISVKRHVSFTPISLTEQFVQPHRVHWCCDASPFRGEAP